MKILYIHGLKHTSGEPSKKVKILEKYFEVETFAPDYENETYADIDRMIYPKLDDVDLIIGTSMGGITAALIGTDYGVPFVSINPCMNPNDLEGIAGEWPAFPKNGQGLILLDEGDELFDSIKTGADLQKHYSVVMFPEGNHRFEHMEQAIEYIKLFAGRSEVSYGIC